SDGRCKEPRFAGRAAASEECADSTDERARLRQELSLRAQRAGRLCSGRELFSRRHAAAAVLPSGAARSGNQDRRSPRKEKREKGKEVEFANARSQVTAFRC